MWRNILKYLLEGLGIAIATKILLGKKTNISELILITISITATFIILDQFAPSIASGARQGAGFGAGLNVVQFGAGRQTMQRGGMDDKVAIDYYSHNNQAKISEHGQPIMHLNDRTVEDKMDQIYPSEDLQRSTASQVDFIGRFMDDRLALSQKRKKHSCRNMHEQFTSNINNEVVSKIMGFSGFSGQSLWDKDANAPSLSLWNENFESPAQQATQAPSAPSSQPAQQSHDSVASAAERGLVYGTITVTPDQRHLSRVGGTVYSGDLVTVRDTDGNLFTVLDNNKYVVPSVTADGNKLFKLRFELKSGHDVTKLIPLKYGSQLYLLFNNDLSETIKISNKSDLSTVDDSSNVFELVNANRVDDIGVVNFNDDILIKKVVDGEKLQYLKVNTTRQRVETKADVNSATKFKLEAGRGCGPLWRF